MRGEFRDLRNINYCELDKSESIKVTQIKLKSSELLFILGLNSTNQKNTKCSKIGLS